MDHKTIEDLLLSFPAAKLSYPFGEEAAVYKIEAGDDPKMFAIIREKTDPLQLSLKCDPQLAEHLRQKYEEVLPGYHLNKKHWNTILLSGQLSEQEVHDLIRLSYDLVLGAMPKAVQAQINPASA